MAKTYKTETSPREIILVSLDQEFTEKPVRTSTGIWTTNDWQGRIQILG